MASRAENRVVNLAGLVQGITLVTFPAASSIFTAADGYDLSNTLYGGVFLPHVLTAIATSLLGVCLARRISAKRVLLIGLAANIISMVVLVVSTGFESDLAVAYPMLLVATAFLGAGFGLTVPVPRAETTVASGQPVQRAGIPPRFWLIAAFAVLYGIMSAGVAGGVIAFHQVGYGIAAFGVGPLVDRGTGLSTIYGWTAVAAAAMALLSFAVARQQPSPERLHPRPTGHAPAPSPGANR